MTVTLADVAARARVSPATVSRVLNGNYPVAASTRERVLRAVDDLDYVLNGPASSLAAATSDLVGILVNDIADPFFGIMAGAAQTEIGGPGDGSGRAARSSRSSATPAAPRARAHLSHPAPAPARRGRRPDRRCRGGPGAPGRGLRQADETRGRGHPGGAVRAAPLPDGEAVVAALAFDNRGGGRRLTEHLLSLGHRRIGYVAGPLERTTTRHRLEGHRDALRAAGLVGDEERLTVHGPYDRRSGYDATLELLRREPEVTAVVAANDTVALGASAAIRDRGCASPRTSRWRASTTCRSRWTPSRR